MDIPWQQLQPATLRSLIEEFISRSGTDYGHHEISQETKLEQIYQLLKAGKIKVVFDPESETCDIHEVLGRGLNASK